MKSIMLLRKNWETFSDTISYGKEGLHKKITLKKAFSKEGGKQILNYLSLKEWDTFFFEESDIVCLLSHISFFVSVSILLTAFYPIL